jgi:hypothetical protein
MIGAVVIVLLTGESTDSDDMAMADLDRQITTQYGRVRRRGAVRRSRVITTTGEPVPESVRQ